jgi:membrane protein implicated in regulation of membrane protease activity
MILSISEWWPGLDALEKVYWIIAIPFSVLFLLQTIMTFFMGDISDADASGDVDASIDGDEGIGFQFLSLKNLVAFFTIFGWTGIACINSGLSVPITIVISLSAGILMMAIMATLMYFMWKLTDDGTLRLINAKGKIGTVYLPIPGKRAGMGKVQVSVQGLQTLDAMTDNDEELATGTIIEVIDIFNNETLIVKPSTK